MYCGNNRRNKDVMDGTKVIGNRYSCMKKGIGVGLNLPYDPDYARRYVPIDARKIYCGTNARLPEGYDIMGSNGMCYTKGVGVGRSMKAKKKRAGAGFGSRTRKSGRSGQGVRKSPKRKSRARKGVRKTPKKGRKRK